MKDFKLHEQGNIDFLNEKGISFCLVQLTENILSKSIFDATTQIRAFLKNEGIHDFSLQKNGQDNKMLINTYILTFARVIKTETSLYRAGTRGDERMWFGSPIIQITKPDDIYAILAKERELYLINISRIDIESLWKSSVPNPVREFLIDKTSNTLFATASQLPNSTGITPKNNKTNNDVPVKTIDVASNPIIQQPADIEPLKEEFAKYLLSKGMSEKSVKKYASHAPNNQFVKSIVLKELGLPSLFAISNKEQARQIYKQVCKAQFNKDGHNMYSVAIHHYCKFLEAHQVDPVLLLQFDSAQDDCLPTKATTVDGNTETYISVLEAADMVGVTSETIRNLCKNKLIRYKKHWSQFFPCREDVLNYAQSICEIHAIKQDIKRYALQLEKEREELRLACVEAQIYRDEIKMTPQRMQKLLELLCAFIKQYDASPNESLDSRDLEILNRVFNGESFQEVAQKMKLSRERVRQLWNALLEKITTTRNELERKEEYIKSQNAAILALKEKIRILEERLIGVNFGVKSKDAPIIDPDVLSMSIDELNFTTRTMRGLQSANIRTLRDLVQTSRRKILGLPNIGKKSLAELDDWMELHNLDYEMPLSDISTPSK